MDTNIEKILVGRIEDKEVYKRFLRDALFSQAKGGEESSWMRRVLKNIPVENILLMEGYLRDDVVLKNNSNTHIDVILAACNLLARAFDSLPYEELLKRRTFVWIMYGDVGSEVQRLLKKITLMEKEIGKS